MKKVFLAILTFLYISSSIGVTLHSHYCMEVLNEGKLSYHKSKMCDKCGKEKINRKDNGCCKDENKFFKNDNDQSLPEPALQLTHLTVVAIPPSYIEISLNKLASITVVNPISHAPPLNSSISLYIRNCVFLI